MGSPDLPAHDEGPCPAPGCCRLLLPGQVHLRGVHQRDAQPGLVREDLRAYITEYLVNEFCPTTEDEDCANHIGEHYVEMIYAIINHFVIDGATHICQLMTICGVKVQAQSQAPSYTCEECIAGLDFVADYLLDDMEINEFTVFLEQNYCNPDNNKCPGQIVKWFPTMHRMAMEEFFIPTDICNKEPVCTGETKPTPGPEPTKPGVF